MYLRGLKWPFPATICSIEEWAKVQINLSHGNMRLSQLTLFVKPPDQDEKIFLLFVGNPPTYRGIKTRPSVFISPEKIPEERHETAGPCDFIITFPLVKINRRGQIFDF